MRPTFLPRLVNGPFDDPALFIPFLFEKRAFLFDLGEIHALSARDILKISHVFVTHTHMDHFVGFDRLLRLFLGRKHHLYLYGPQGFLKNVEGKLSAYTWNLVEHYRHRLILTVVEVLPDGLLSKVYVCQNRFRATRDVSQHPFGGILLKEPALTVSAVILDHKIPCLGFSITERFHVNIMKDRLADLKLQPGPWLNEFKQALYNQKDPDIEFEVSLDKEGLSTKRFVLGDLADGIALITPGQKITYFADVVYSRSNEVKMISFAKDSDHLFIEAAFLEKDRDIAAQRWHLTARQAGCIAAQAGVKQFTPFHFSPRYSGQEELIKQEAMEAFNRETTSK